MLKRKVVEFSVAPAFSGPGSFFGGDFLRWLGSDLGFGVQGLGFRVASCGPDLAFWAGLAVSLHWGVPVLGLPVLRIVKVWGLD